MSHVVAALASGLVFAIGLGLAGMTQPAKVFGFLNVFGNWDPSLAFVMMGAIGVHFFAYRLARRRMAPVAEKIFDLPTATAVDRRLVAGAAVFGVGWVLSGYCPGPAVVSLASGMLAPLVMVATMIVGMMIHEAWLGTARTSSERRAPAEDLV